MNGSLRGWLVVMAVMLSVKLMLIASFMVSQVSADDPNVQVSPTVESPQVTEPSVAPEPTVDNEKSDRPRPTEEARRTYLERIVATPMSHLGASWLVRPERQAEENAEKALSLLGLTAGMIVCDLGCGNGYWTLPMAKAVGESGTVYAVDIQPEMLRQLRTRMGKANLKNAKSVLGTVDDPKLPADAQLDLLLMVDVYHEFSHPESMLWAIRRALAPEGVIALLEYREEDPNVPIKPLHKMSKRQIMKEYSANGLKLVRESNELPWQHLMFFARDDSPLPAIEPEPFVAAP